MSVGFQVNDSVGNEIFSVVNTAKLVLFSDDVVAGQTVTFTVPDIYTVFSAYYFCYTQFDPDHNIQYPTIHLNGRSYTITGNDSKPFTVYILGR